MKEITGKKVRIDSGEAFKVEQHMMADGIETIVLQRNVESFTKTKKKKKNKDRKAAFTFGDLDEKIIKGNITKGADLGYSSFESVTYSGELRAQALDVLSEAMGSKVPVAYVNDNNDIIFMEVDTIGFHPKKPNTVTVRDVATGQKENVPLQGLLDSMLLDQEVMAAKEALGLEKFETRDEDEEVDEDPISSFRDKEQFKNMPDELKDVLDGIAKKIVDDIVGGAKSKPNPKPEDFFGGLDEVLAKLKSEASSSSRRTSKPEDLSEILNGMGMPSGLRTILKDILK